MSSQTIVVVRRGRKFSSPKQYMVIGLDVKNANATLS